MITSKWFMVYMLSKQPSIWGKYTNSSQLFKAYLLIDSGWHWSFNCRRNRTFDKPNCLDGQIKDLNLNLVCPPYHTNTRGANWYLEFFRVYDKKAKVRQKVQKHTKNLVFLLNRNISAAVEAPSLTWTESLGSVTEQNGSEYPTTTLTPIYGKIDYKHTRCDWH